MDRRTGDSIVIDGAYQHRALHEGPRVQRFWHYSKQLTIAAMLPPAAGDYVLDIGCGSGAVSGFLGRCGATVLGIDGNPEAIAFARRTYEGPNVHFQHGLVDDDFHPDRPVDKAYCLELIEHIHRPQAAKLLSTIHARLRPGGQCFLTTPNYHSAWPAIEWTMDRLKLAPALKDCQHVEFYHRRKLRQLCLEAGFAVEKMASYCFLAPWLAAASWRLAERMHRIELSANTGLGSILACVLKKP